MRVINAYASKYVRIFTAKKWYITAINKLPQANLLLVSKQYIRDLGWLIKSCYNVVFSTYGKHIAKFSTRS